MDAMILAAGLGTRLRPLTNDVPKALVRVGDVAMLERVADRLVDAGADRLVINVHHHGDKVEAFLAEWSRPGVEVRISREDPEVLETGGGLKHAREHFRGDAPFILHNVDVISTVDLEALHRDHVERTPLATLAVSDRDTSRPLLFDERGLYGHGLRDGSVRTARPPEGETRALGFCGIHVLDPRILDLMDEEGKFSIIPVYMRLAADGERILPWDIGDALWVDVGTHERLARAREIVGA
jgi:NDP-sugar pyrophosphorylase family protein